MDQITSSSVIVYSTLRKCAGGDGVRMQVTKLFSFDEITLHGEPGPTHRHLLTTGKPGPLPFLVGHFVAKGHAAREEVSPHFPWS